MIGGMYPILARYGSIFIYSYTIMLALGIIVGIGLTAWKNHNRPAHDWFDAALIIFLGAIIGGRIGFVVLHWDYFQERLPEVWQFWRGGLSYHPALLAGLVALFLWAIFNGQSFYQFAALLIPAFILVFASGWGACWLEGCAYGRETALGPLAADLPDDLGVSSVRYQSQLIGILLTTLLFLVMIRIGRHMSAAHVFWFTLGAISLIHLIVGLLRGDPVPQLLGLRLDLLIDGLLVIVTIILLQFEIFKTNSITPNMQD